GVELDLYAYAPITAEATKLSEQIVSGQVQPVPPPGCAFQIEVEANDEKMRADVAAHAEKRLRALGHKIGAGGLTLQLKTKAFFTGQDVEYWVSVPDGKVKKLIAEIRAHCRMRILDRGKPLFDKEDGFGPPNFITIGANVKDDLMRQGKNYAI